MSKRKTKPSQTSPDDSLYRDAQGRTEIDFWRDMRKRAAQIVADTLGPEAPTETVDLIARAVVSYWASLPHEKGISQGVRFEPAYAKGATMREGMTPEEYRRRWEGIVARIIQLESGRWGHEDSPSEDHLTTDIRRFIAERRRACDRNQTIARGGAVKVYDDAGVFLIMFAPDRRPRQRHPQALKILAVLVKKTLDSQKQFAGDRVGATLRLLESLGVYRLPTSKSDPKVSVSNPADFRRLLARWKREVAEALKHTDDTVGPNGRG